MINFVCPIEPPYINVVKSFIDPIIIHMPRSSYRISHMSIPNAINVYFFREEKHLKEVGLNGKTVFLSHGLADKNWRDPPNVQMFNYICVSGDLWIDKYIKGGFSRDRLLLNGYTRLDPLFDKLNYFKNNNDKNVILFAPTHDSSISLNDDVDLLNIIKIKRPNYNFIESKHPANNGSKITFDRLLEADVIISDFSSMIYESWSLGKPVVFPSWIMRSKINKHYKNSFEQKIYNERIGYHANDIEDLCMVIDKALENGISQKSINFIDGIFNKELRGCSGKTTADLLMNISI